VAIGIGASGHRLTTALGSAVARALITTVGFWWVYFDRFAAIAEDRLRTHDDPVLAAADGYSYLHLLLVAGIIVFAVGAKESIAHVDHHLPAGARYALYGGASLYLVGHVAFRARMLGTIHYAQLVVAAALLGLAALLSGLAAWGTLGVLALAFVALVGWEIGADREAASKNRLRADGIGAALRRNASRLARFKEI
jgi:low temperature requirement protein LtrA